ncbi:MAG: hypothetical protein ACREA2_15485 [Blastocatellia bacterium]
MRYKEKPFLRLLTHSAFAFFILLITVAALPTLWERSVALGVSYKEETSSNAQSQRSDIAVAVYKPKVLSGEIMPRAFADRLIAAMNREAGFKAKSVEQAIDPAKAKQVAADLGFKFILYTTISGKEAKSTGKKVKGWLGGVVRNIPGGGNNDDNDKGDTKPEYKVEVEYELVAVDQNDPVFKGKAQGQKGNEEEAVAEVVRQMTFDIFNVAREAIALQRDPNPAPGTGENKKPAKVDVEYSRNKPRLVVQTSHSTMVTDYAYNPDGTLLATMGGDGVVKIWNTIEKKEINTFPGFRTVGITFSPNGKNLAILSKDGSVRIFDAATGELLRKMSELTVNKEDDGNKREGIGLMFDPPVSMSYDRDGSILVTGGERGIRVWDVSSGRAKQTIREEINLLALSPDGKIVAGASEDDKSVIKLWATSDGRDLPKINSNVETVTALAFSPDGQSLACGSRNGSIKLFDVNSGVEKKIIVDRCDSAFEKVKKYDPILTKVPIFGGKIRDIGGIIPIACQIDRVIKGAREQGAVKGLTRGFMNYMLRSVRSVSLNYDRDLIAYVSADGVIRTRSIRGNRELYQIGKSIFGNQLDNSAKKSAEDSKKDDDSKPADVVTSNFFFLVAPIKFSTDGDYLNGVTAYKNVSRWESGTGKQVSALAASDRDLMGGFFIPFPLGAVPIFTRDGNSIFTVSLTKGTKLWDLKRGTPPRQVSGLSALPFGNKAPLSPDGQTFVQLNWKREKKENEKGKEKEIESDDDATRPITKTTVSIRDFISKEEKQSADLDGAVVSAHFSPDQRFIAMHVFQDGPTLRLYDLSNLKKEVFSQKDVTHFEFSGEGQLLACLFGQEEETKDIKIFGLGDWKEVFKAKVKNPQDRWLTSPMAFGSDGKLLAAMDGNSIKIWDISTKKIYRQRELDYTEDLSNLIFAPGKQVLSYTTYHALYHWDLEGNKVEQSSMITDFWGNLSYSKDGKILALGGAENRIRLFNIEEDKEIGSLIVPSQEDWLVVTPEGRLDTSRLEEIKEVHWIMPDDPFNPLSLEIFMQDYYETTLLQRLLGEKQRPFDPISNLALRNRVQPEVKISGIEPQNAAADLLTVDVEVMNNVGSFIRDGKKETVNSGVYNVRLFRDGQRVGGTDGPIKLESGKARIRFRNIKAPRSPNIKSVEFTAYAFNSDRVKSKTVSMIYDLPSSTRTAERRAYIITMGVEVGPHPNWDLKLTVPDARAIENLLVEKLKSNYEITPIPLISNYKGRGIHPEFLNATKQNLSDALKLLAGGKISPGRLAQIPNAGRIRAATPDDLVVVFIASHGINTPGGKLYLVPYFEMDDAGAVNAKKLTDCAGQAGGQSDCALARQFLDLSISVDDFARWFDDVDAGEIALIIDSCHSGAVSGEGFKPGPFADTGFGQLSYDKGMMILAATQADSPVIVEGANSILTEVLVKQSAFEGAFDLRDWMSRARYAAPYSKPSSNRPDVQVPIFFDFARKKTTAVVPAAPAAK